MQRAAIKSSDLVQRTSGKDLLAHGLVELIRAAASLLQRINTQISSTTHEEVVDDIALYRECELCLKEYYYIANAAIKIVGPVEGKINSFYRKKGFVREDSFPAHSWSPVILLNLLREQAMGRRQQEIQEIEKKKRDIIHKLEADVAACKSCFAQIVPQLNLLCYMKDCYQSDHALPATVMYQTNIKQTVRSPFDMEASVVKVVPPSRLKKLVTALPKGQMPMQKDFEEISPKELLCKMRALQQAENEKINER